MKLFLKILLVFCLPLGICSQNRYTDSLENSLKNSAEKDRPKILNRLAEVYLGTKTETAAIKAEEAYQLAVKYQDHKQMLNALKIIADIQVQEGNYDKGIAKLKTALPFFKAQDDSLQYTGSLQRSMAEIYLYKSQFDTALMNYKAAIHILKRTSDKDELLAALNGIAATYYYMGDYQKALSFYLENLRLAETMHRKPAIAQALLNTGNIYFTDNNFDKALFYYNKALALTKEIKDKEETARILNNIGNVYENKNDNDKALSYHLKSLELKEELGDKNEIVQSLQNIGNAYTNKGNYKEALDYYEKSLKLNRELGSKNGTALGLINMGNLYVKTKQYGEAIAYLNKGLALSKEINRKELIKSAYEYLADVYNKNGDYKNAYDYKSLYGEIKDSLLNEQRVKSMTEMSAKYESDKQEKEIQLLKQAGELRNHKDQREALLKYSLIVFSCLLLALAFLIYSRYRVKQKAHDKLEAINSELEKLSLVASKTDNSVIITNEKGEIEWVNSGFTRLSGYALEEFLVQKGRYIRAFSSAEGIETLLEESIAKKTSLIYESINEAKNGKKYWVQSTLTPIFDEQEKLKKIVIIDSDITKRKQDEELIKSKNKDITDSINYAKQIQSAILPSLTAIEQGFPESFILYRPKDIVSGDFYWYTQSHSKSGKTSSYLAAVDCTGHGVPGAFMSMIGNDLLEQIVKIKKITDPGKILTELNNGIKLALHQTDGNSSKDGMDIALCKLSTDENNVRTLHYAGAFRPLWCVNAAGEFTEITADKRAIGGITEMAYEFTNHRIMVNAGDSFYMFSDGYVDQFGGEKGKKFLSVNLRKLLLNSCMQSITDQKQNAEKAFDSWKGEHEQIDDVLLIGFRIC